MDIVLNTYGNLLSRDNEAFVITHKEGKQRISPDGVGSILIGKSTQITSDAILLAIEKEIEILLLDKAGQVLGRVWSAKYGSISTIRKGQLAFLHSVLALEWVKELLQNKFENQQALLLSMQTEDEIILRKTESAIHKISTYIAKIKEIEGDSLSDCAAQLRGVEGAVSRIYFDRINLFLPENYRFTHRSQHPALDIVNALLNYGYGILYGKIEGSLIKAGIDPYIGIFHRDDYNRPVLVYDVIEKYRVWVDYVVILLATKSILSEEYYSVKSDGSVWLEALGRRILIQSIQDYLEEPIKIKDLIRSRATHIDLYAQSLSSKFKKLG